MLRFFFFQAQWDEGLKAIEEAFWVSPKAIHRYVSVLHVVCVC